MMHDTKRRSQAHFDWPLMVAMYALSLFGLLCITMATYDVGVSADAPLLNRILNSRSSMWQSIFILVSPIILFVIMAIPTELFRIRADIIYFGVFGLLLITLVMGQVVSGLRGWLTTGFGRSMQPSEFAKISVLLMLAMYLSKNNAPMSKFKSFSATVLIAAVPAGVILLQGETGTVIVLVFMFLAMIYFAGVNTRVLACFLTIIGLGIAALVIYGKMAEDPDYRLVRILAFLDPQQYRQSGGYQTLRSQETIGAGQMSGVGLFMPGSMTTLQYVPESSTDFIFTVVGECFGFVGCISVLAVYLFMVLRMIYLAQFTQDKFGQLVIVGVTATLFFHVFQNVAMTLGMMPITGIPLPFLSYGGSNYVTNVASIALVMNVTKSRAVTTTSTLKMPRMLSPKERARQEKRAEKQQKRQRRQQRA